MQTIVDFRSFDPKFQSGLVFSIIEGLLQGKAIKAIFDHDPVVLEGQFKAARIENLSWLVVKTANSIWEVEIAKRQPASKGHEAGGCCGICGGHKE